ncbi:ArnT family glycosyltransferase [Arthrobacter rhizosphaerae]|uniref:ArnT family glycosyltransferase n=1 Tax=Arthrobacter rhizosphaerae TaxID=2855490 RepID=UPI001FF219A2|nr:glycosyltransferase family 39 protein [Arthrobacter rhizosphaerae]
MSSLGSSLPVYDGDLASSSARPVSTPGQEKNETKIGSKDGTVPRWEKRALLVVLGLTALLYLWGLDRNGWANPYYSAAAQAGATDWKAWFFGSVDAGNLITIDKTPLSVWVTGLSVRLFGLSSWSILVPQALMGVMTTWLIYKIVRRQHSAVPALFGALIYASTPVVVLMSRFNNPEPLMGLLVVAAVYFTVRVLENNAWKWYVLIGAALGFAFMAKQVQAFVVIPAIVFTVLLLGTGQLRTRTVRLVSTIAAMAVSGGWWIAVVDLTPPDQRPYMGGSSMNSAVQLTTNYNGLARFLRFGSEDNTGAVSSSQGVDGVVRSGLSRLFDANFAQEAAWLLFIAFGCSVVLLLLRAPGKWVRIQPLPALSAVWFLTGMTVLTFAGTMVHSYYTFSLAAPMALVIPLGLQQLWGGRDRIITRMIGAVLIMASAYLAGRIVTYSNEWPPGWQILILVVGGCACVLWMLPGTRHRLIVVSAVGASLLLGPLATNAYTVTRPQAGTNPLSGPASNVDGSLSKKFEAAKAGLDQRSLQLAFGAPPDSDLVRKLATETDDQTWAAATITAQNAALYQLESKRPVVALGGWLGQDPAPTLEQFQLLVKQNRIGFLIAQDDLLARDSAGGEAVRIFTWVKANFDEQPVGNAIVFDLRE